MAMDRVSPRDKFFGGQPVQLASLRHRQQSAVHCSDDLKLEKRWPAPGWRRRRKIDRQAMMIWCIATPAHWDRVRHSATITKTPTVTWLLVINDRLKNSKRRRERDHFGTLLPRTGTGAFRGNRHSALRRWKGRRATWSCRQPRRAYGNSASCQRHGHLRSNDCQLLAQSADSLRRSVTSGVGGEADMPRTLLNRRD
jgi:hypothetical protein